MLLNLTDVFTSEGKDRRESLLFEPEAVSYMGEEYDILEKSLIQLTLSNVGTGKVLVDGKLTLCLDMPCDRCLKSVKVPLNVNFMQEVYAPDALPQEEQDAQSFVEGYELDVEALVKAKS